MRRITMSGDVGWEIKALGIREELAAANGDEIEVVISSRGGLVGEGLEIFNLIRNYPGRKTAILSGYAMSMASYIPMAFDRVVAEDNAVMMIHNAWGIAVGDHNEMAKIGTILGGLSHLLSGGYARFTGRNRQEIGAMMDAETWLFGDQITAAGFAHETVAAEEHDGDQESAMAAAQLHFSGVCQRLAADKAVVQSDLSRVAAMVPGGIGNTGDVPRTPSTTEPVMDLKTLKEKHPELVAAIVAEATAGFNDQLAAARQEGAAAEQRRIAEVRAQAIAGHEQLIETLAADGKTTGAEAAMAIVAAEKALRSQAAVDSQQGNRAAAPVGDQQAAGGKTMKRADWNKLSAQAQRDFINAGGKVVD